MKYVVKVMDFEAVNNDTPVENLTVVLTVSTLKEIEEWAKSEGHTFRRDLSLFGGYYRKYDGTCYLVDVVPNMVAPDPNYSTTMTVEGLSLALAHKNPLALVYMSTPNPNNFSWAVKGVMDDVLTDGVNDTPVVLIDTLPVRETIHINQIGENDGQGSTGEGS